MVAEREDLDDDNQSDLSISSVDTSDLSDFEEISSSDEEIDDGKFRRLGSAPYAWWPSAKKNDALQNAITTPKYYQKFFLTQKTFPDNLKMKTFTH